MMEQLSWWINILGIIMSALGTFLVFKGTPIDSTGHIVLQETYVRKDEYMKDFNKMIKRGKLSRWGLGALLCGFVIQFLGQLFNYPS